MLVYKDGKVYFPKGDRFVEVEIYLDKILPISGTDVNLKRPYVAISFGAALLKFNVSENAPIKVSRPRKKKETRKG